MKAYQFLVFIAIVISIYFLTNWYLYNFIFKSLNPNNQGYKYIQLSFYVFASSFVIGMFLDRAFYSTLSDVFVWIGTFWLAFMLYLFLFATIFHLVQLIGLAVPPVADFIDQFRTNIFYIGFGLITLIIIFGHLNAINPKVKNLEITLDKGIGSEKVYQIALATDIHLGSQIKNNYLNKIVTQINNLEPDLVLFAGDLINDNLTPVIKHEMGPNFQKIKSKFGVYAITGNHEYIGNPTKAVEYLSQYDIVFLRDSFVEIDEHLILAGRDDKDRVRFAGEKIPSLNHILSKQTAKATILLDHQPARLQEAMDQNVDLVLCGHTHHGQMWPFNFVTQAVYPLSWGLKKFKNTFVYVSCGVGTWGPRVRIGNRPEIVNLKLIVK